MPPTVPSSDPARNPEPEFDLQAHGHTVQFYSDATFLLAALSRFMGAAMGAGDAAIVIATPAHREELAQRLAARGLEVARAVEQGRYVALDAAETLAQFMVDGWPDEKRFVELIGGVITRAKAAANSQHGRAALFGEMVALLWAEGNTEGALRLEQLWNQIAQSHAFSLVCAYPLGMFYQSDHADAFLRICAEHSAVLPAESYALAPADERLRIIAQWQQKAQALQLEISKRNLAQEAATRLAAIVESSDDAIVSKDLNGIVTSWNAAAERMFEYTPEEIIGKPITTIIPPGLQHDEDMILSKVRRGERIEHYETVRVSKSGKRLDVSLSIFPVKDASGRVIGAAKIARDITHRRQTEAALRHAERLAANGQLAATIAHEINNPMQALTNLLSLVGYRTSRDDTTHQLVALAESELKRMAHITRQMLSFYRESSAPVRLKITEVIEDILEVLVMNLRTHHIKVERRYEFDDPIRAFPVEMRQLFANLLSNAAEAIGRDGRITVHVTASRDWSKPDSTGVRIIIADTGPGIEPAMKKRIFEPFFTTKEEKGTGLGLWVVKGIVTKHQGCVRFRSSTRPGRSGTVFSIFLPAEIGLPALSAPPTAEGSEAAA